MPHRILYVVHSSAPGGALLSLRYLLDALDRDRYEPVAVCLHDVPEVMDTLRAANVETLHAPGLAIVPHTTGGWHRLTTPFGILRAVRDVGGFRSGARAMEALVRRIRPDLVHLNSLVLAPCAAGARAAGVRVVWHVRESVHPGHLGVRRRWLAHAVRRWADEAIFISHDDRRRLTGGEFGVVIPNWVDHRRFDRALDGGAVRRELGIPAAAPLVLHLGGVGRLKGGNVLLPALLRARSRVPGLRAVIAGAEGPWSRSVLARTARAVLPLVGSGTPRQRFLAAYERGNMGAWVRLLPFRPDPERLIAAADVVIFPSTAPHFARPVIEAGAMGKPVVASRLGGVEELVNHERTGLLVAPDDAAELGDGIARLLCDPALAARLGEAGYAASRERYSLEANVRRVVAVYEALLSGAAGEPARGARTLG